MAIIAKENGRNYEPAPEGVHKAVCCDVVDMGMVESNYNGHTKMVHKIRVVFQINKTMPSTGKRFLVSGWFTLSLTKKANLYKFLQSWRGKNFTPEELKDGFDIEKVIGKNCMLQVIHTVRDDTTYANIQSVMPFTKDMGEPLEVEDYTRVIDREDQSTTSGKDFEDYPDTSRADTSTAANTSFEDDDDIPF